MNFINLGGVVMSLEVWGNWEEILVGYTDVSPIVCVCFLIN